MSTSPLEAHATAMREALLELNRGLADSRGEWGDDARHVFDRRHADPILADGRRLVDELSAVANDLTAAHRTLDNLS